MSAKWIKSRGIRFYKEAGRPKLVVQISSGLHRMNTVSRLRHIEPRISFSANKKQSEASSSISDCQVPTRGNLLTCKRPSNIEQDRKLIKVLMGTCLWLFEGNTNLKEIIIYHYTIDPEHLDPGMIRLSTNKTFWKKSPTSF